MKKALLSKLWEAFISVVPVAGIVLFVSFTPLARLTWLERTVFLACALLLAAGIGLFNLGADLAMSPMGRHAASVLRKGEIAAASSGFIR